MKIRILQLKIQKKLQIFCKNFFILNNLYKFHVFKLQKFYKNIILLMYFLLYVFMRKKIFAYSKKYNNFSQEVKRVFVFLGGLACFILIYLGPINDDEAIFLYLDKLQNLSNHTILNRQKKLVVDFYRKHANDHPERYERKCTRTSFNQRKATLKKAWEEEYSLQWILDPYQIKINNKNTAFDAHHIIPINAGGVNEWWNLTPLSHMNHQKLHASIEEHACFEHNLLFRFFYRLQLNLKKKIFVKFKRISIFNWKAA